MIEFQSFVTQLASTTTYKQWAVKHGADADRWNSFSKAILAGNSPSAPAMSTGFGKALLQVGLLAMAKSAGFGISRFGEGSFGEK